MGNDQDNRNSILKIKKREGKREKARKRKRMDELKVQWGNKGDRVKEVMYRMG